VGESIARKKILIIVQPAYGDSIMLKSILDNVIAGSYEIDVLTKEKFKDIFSTVQSLSNVICGDFPIWYNKHFCIASSVSGWYKARMQKYDIVLDYIGDFRDRYIGYFCGGKKFITVERADGHPFNNLIRRGLGCLADEKIFIPGDVVNIYDQIKFVFEQIGFNFRENSRISKGRCEIIGLHPFASQECRKWSFENWRFLIKKLLEYGKKIILFGAPNERKVLEEQFGMYGKRVELFTGSLQEFMNKLTELDLLIGLDSFSIHAAYAAGVRNIMINGANDYRMWQTPLTTVVHAHEGSCKYWPCYNKPKCNGKYECINSIIVEDVIEKVMELANVETVS